MQAKSVKERYQSIHEVWTNLKELAEVSEAERFYWRPWKLAAVVSLVLLVSAISGWLVYNLFLPPSQEIDSFAILRFETEGDHPDLETLAVGIPESLISKLSPLPTLRVISSLSSFHFSPSSDLSEIRAALDVEAVVAGRLVSVGEDFSLNVQLIDTRDKAQLWGQQFNSAVAERVKSTATLSRQVSRTESKSYYFLADSLDFLFRRLSIKKVHGDKELQHCLGISRH